MRCVGAKWIDEEGKWKVSVENVDTAEIIEDECDILISCTGIPHTPVQK
jgi:cation diffusion facilitator CzcD-associated flavoprotein CzcO